MGAALKLTEEQFSELSEMKDNLLKRAKQKQPTRGTLEVVGCTGCGNSCCGGCVGGCSGCVGNYNGFVPN